MKFKKGQEEIVGFVLIMVIVAVVFLIFLGISIRGPGESRLDSIEISQFLESSMEYTTSCARNFVPNYASLGELFDDCLSGNRCIDGGDTCEVLNQTLEEIFESTWKASPDGPIRGYNFTSFYTTNSTNEEIISLGDGSCEGSKRGASFLIPSFPGRIENSLEICS